jgi:hypothetical protein
MGAIMRLFVAVSAAILMSRAAPAQQLNWVQPFLSKFSFTPMLRGHGL